jgi:hypothetical protein
VVTELRGEGKSQRRVTAVHVIDVLYLGGEDLRRLHFMERQKQAALFLRVVNKASRSDLVRMRMKAVFKLEVFFFYSFLSVLEIDIIYDADLDNFLKLDIKDSNCHSLSVHDRTAASLFRHFLSLFVINKEWATLHVLYSEMNQIKSGLIRKLFVKGRGADIFG